MMKRQYCGLLIARSTKARITNAVNWTARPSAEEGLGPGSANAITGNSKASHIRCVYIILVLITRVEKNKLSFLSNYFEMIRVE